MASAKHFDDGGVHEKEPSSRNVMARQFGMDQSGVPT